MWYVILLLLIIIVVLLVISRQPLVEGYNGIARIEEKEEKKKCPYKFRSEASYCPQDKNLKCEKCAYKRVGLEYRSDVGCCHYKCKAHTIKKLEDQFIEQGRLKKPAKSFYCRHIYWCSKKYPDKNGMRWCGIRNVDNQPAPIYDTKAQCVADINKFSLLDRHRCLRTSGAGWCTGRNGDGICVEGAQDRPRDLFRYGYCFPNRVNGVNAYIPGSSSQFVIRNFGDNDF